MFQRPESVCSGGGVGGESWPPERVAKLANRVGRRGGALAG